MHHFVTEMCTFLLQNGALWYGTGALWDLWDGSIAKLQHRSDLELTKFTLLGELWGACYEYLEHTDRCHDKTILCHLIKADYEANDFLKIHL